MLLLNTGLVPVDAVGRALELVTGYEGALYEEDPKTGPVTVLLALEEEVVPIAVELVFV